MLKQDLESVIKKYYLGNPESNPVKFVIVDNNLTIDFISVDFTTLGKIESNFDAADGIYYINNPKRLLTMLNSLGSEISVSISYYKNIAHGLIISDNVVSIVFAFCDESKIVKIPDTSKFPTEWDFELELKPDLVKRLIKSFSAFEKPIVALETETTSVNFITNYDEKLNTDRITIPFPAIIKNHCNIIKFNSDSLNVVLSANTDYRTATLCVSSEGLMKLVFTGEDSICTYFMKPNN